LTKLFYIMMLVSINLLFANGYLTAQELEPRALTNIPKGMNFVAVGTAYSFGNILVDPAIEIEDLKSQIITGLVAYNRSVDILGKSGKLDIIIPFGYSDYHGVFEGNSFHDISEGIGDIRLRASINITGAPALSAKEYANYNQKTVSGLSVQAILPTGAYHNNQLVNLGSNRYTLRINYGISHTFDSWVIEAYGGLWLFSTNNEFLGDFSISQSPLWVIKSHLVKVFSKGKWIAFDAGYGIGGQTFINNEKRDAIISLMRLGLTMAWAFNKNHSLKLAAWTGIRFEQGPDFETLGLVYQYKWLSK
jgi:hypothetical protein